MKRLRSLLLFFVLMLIASLSIACGSLAEPATAEPPTATPIPPAIPTPASSSEVPRITPQELKNRLDNGEDILIIDTRSESAYDVQHIAGAVKASEYKNAAQDQVIVLYCA